MQPSKASSRDWAHDPRADWRSRKKRNSRQGPPDKMVMGRWPTLQDENRLSFALRRAPGHVEVVWLRIPAIVIAQSGGS